MSSSSAVLIVLTTSQTNHNQFNSPITGNECFTGQLYDSMVKLSPSSKSLGTPKTVAFFHVGKR